MAQIGKVLVSAGLFQGAHKCTASKFSGLRVWGLGLRGQSRGGGGVQVQAIHDLVASCKCDFVHG